MKRQMLAFVGVLALLLVGGSAYAQSNQVTFNIPFNFIVNGKTLPSGEYGIQAAGASDLKTLLIRAPEPKANMFVQTEAVESMQAATKSKLVFHRYGKQYFLSEVWVEGHLRGNQLPKPSREQEMARDYPLQQVDLVAALR